LRVMWNGFFDYEQKIHIFKRLAIQFSETDLETAIAFSISRRYGPSRDAAYKG
jgi:hypothetical protein